MNTTTEQQTEQQDHFPEADPGNTGQFFVFSCRKYIIKGVRVLDFGEEKTVKQASKILGNWKGAECPVCGPLTHSELDFSNYFTCRGAFDTQDQAVALMDKMIESKQYRLG